MKNILAIVLTLMVHSSWATDFKVIKNAPTKKLAAIKNTSSDQTNLKVGQELNLKSEGGATCSFIITKIIPEKSIYFVNTEKCVDLSFLTENTILKNESNDSFPLDDDKKSDDKVAEAKPEAIRQGLPSINESWYTYWGLGWASPSYPSDLNVALNNLKALGATHTGLALDLFGFYWPLENKKTMVGFIVNDVSDSYEILGNNISISQYIYGLSGMHFFGPNIGSGWFLRGDAGIARYSIEFSGPSVGNTISQISKNGFGILAGGGYAWPISTGTRLLLNANIAHRSVESEKVDTMSVTLGLLF